MMRILIVLCFLFSGNLFSAEDKVGPPELAIGTMISSLLLVIVCIFVFAYLMKHTNLLKNARASSQIKVIATQSLTSKGRVQIIEINNQQYLLGVTEQNITLLEKFEKPFMTENDSVIKETSTPFSTILSKISKKKDE